jgi:zinc transport system substrate-binding protein
MLRLLAFCLTAFFSHVALAQGPLVVSTHPIYLIAKEITQGVEEPKLLLENQTGHDVHLTPAHRKLMQEASLIIWLGKAHEAPLDSSLAKNSNAVALLNSGILQTLPLRNSRGEVVNGTVDTHVWLEPNNAVRIGFFIAALRSQQNPEHKVAYWNNAKTFAREMFKASQNVKMLGGVKPYWSLHDAYQYLERPLLLKFSGAMTEDPHMAPTLAQIKYLNESRPQKNMCLLAESATNSNQYRSLGSVNFQAVDESLAKHQNFIIAWQSLANQVRLCVEKAQK